MDQNAEPSPSDQPHPSAAMRKVVGMVGMVVVLIVAGYLYTRQSAPREVSRTCHIVSIDLDKRLVRVELELPKTGKTIEVDGEIGPDCKIIIDGQPAELAQLHPGDTVWAEAIMNSNREIIAKRLERVDDKPADKTS